MNMRDSAIRITHLDNFVQLQNLASKWHYGTWFISLGAFECHQGVK